MEAVVRLSQVATEIVSLEETKSDPSRLSRSAKYRKDKRTSQVLLIKMM